LIEVTENHVQQKAVVLSVFEFRITLYNRELLTTVRLLFVYLLHSRLLLANKVRLQTTAFLDIASCTLVEAERRFRGAYCLHLQGKE
jgi:hypothetical protein